MTLKQHSKPDSFTPQTSSPPESFATRFRVVRDRSQQLCETLEPEDCVVQSMPNASPIRWHLAHTTWFFETFLLKRRPDYQSVDPRFEFLFNSYYNSVGKPFPQHQRGTLSRPTMEEVWQYRESVDRQIEAWCEDVAPMIDLDTNIFEFGLNHEQQHQELMLTDIKHAFAQNPLFPIYRDIAVLPTEQALNASVSSHWISVPESIQRIGHESIGFCFDNEKPAHRRLVDEFEIASNLVTCREFLEFIEDGGYREPRHWLSAGWATVGDRDWQTPEYWHQIDGQWHHFTLGGLMALGMCDPVTHVSYFEADAYARWAGCRLPTEAEWESAVQSDGPEQHLAADSFRNFDSLFHPQMRTVAGTDLSSVLGSTWQWTSSAYDAYPGYRVPEGAIGEYNGKFMCGQFVLRGGSCATPPGHTRITYRNFFPPDTRWQFSGIRLAK